MTATTTDIDLGRALYDEYLAKQAALAPHREYARAVAQATHGSGMTPVRPLATMGTSGGPLLCDFCGKPMILEGGQYNRVYADEAWKRRTGGTRSFADRLHEGDDHAGWRSYISGGMVVDRETNGTLRVYHGYPGNPAHCLGRADAARKKAAEAVDPRDRAAKRGPLLAYLRVAFPDKTQIQLGLLAGEILDEISGYDPGLGVNRPG